MRLVIVGAGCFGGSLAWRAARAGHEVVLVDQFEPGDPRATSGGETRLIRCSHGPDAFYPALAREARGLWRELEAETGEQLLLEVGVAWLAHGDDGWEADSERVLRELGIPCERLDPSVELLPGLDPAGLSHVLYEPEAGVLRAQRATEALARAAREHGATLVRGRAEPDGDGALVGDERLTADAVVWACGPWLGRLFGRVVEIRCTQQDLFFFDVPREWRAAPAWVDFDEAMYGTGDIDGLGMKVAPDEDGPPLDPDAPLPSTREATEARAHAFLEERFPSLAGTDLRSSRSCRYELSSDANFVAARHPEHPATWLFGGGSGHGFKHGPALAERMLAGLAGTAPLPERFGLGERVPARSLRTAGWNR